MRRWRGGKADQERHHLHDAFMAEELVPDVFERATRMVRGRRAGRAPKCSRFAARASTAPTAGEQSTTSSPTGLRPLTGSASAPINSFSGSSSRRGTSASLRSSGFPRGGVPGDVESPAVVSRAQAVRDSPGGCARRASGHAGGGRGGRRGQPTLARAAVTLPQARGSLGAHPHREADGVRDCPT